MSGPVRNVLLITLGLAWLSERVGLSLALGAFLAGGGRKIDRWYGTLKVVEVSFDDEEAGFRNINTRDELVEAAKDLPRTNHG